MDELWQDDVRKVLQWLCFSRRSLTLDEIADALAVTFVDGAKFDPDERYPDPRDILSRCSSLVSLTVTREGEVLRLAHFSVKEYLALGPHPERQGTQVCDHRVRCNRPHCPELSRLPLAIQDCRLSKLLDNQDVPTRRICQRILVAACERSGRCALKGLAGTHHAAVRNP